MGKKMKVYLVFVYDIGYEKSLLQRVFKTKEQAKAYCLEGKNEDPFCKFYWEEWEVL